MIRVLNSIADEFLHMPYILFLIALLDNVVVWGILDFRFCASLRLL